MHVTFVVLGGTGDLTGRLMLPGLAGIVEADDVDSGMDVERPADAVGQRRRGEGSWRIVEPILAAWSAGKVPLLEYPAGSSGPGAG